MKYFLPALMTVALVTGCSTKAPEDPGKASPPKTPKIIGSTGTGISFDAKQLANELESNYVSEVRFAEGKAELTPEARKSLSSVMANARKNGFMTKAKLITWADREMPSEEKKELSEEEIELAKRRNDALSRFIQAEEREIDIDRISMAQRPGGLKKLIPNETARIQKSLEDAGVPEAGEDKDGLGKAGRSIIIFTRE